MLILNHKNSVFLILSLFYHYEIVLIYFEIITRTQRMKYPWVIVSINNDSFIFNTKQIKNAHSFLTELNKIICWQEESAYSSFPKLKSLVLVNYFVCDSVNYWDVVNIYFFHFLRNYYICVFIIFMRFWRNLWAFNKMNTCISCIKIRFLSNKENWFIVFTWWILSVNLD